MKTKEVSHDEPFLLAELKVGSKDAFNYFYDKYSVQLYRRLLRLVQLDVIAEELLQDLFTKIWDKRELIDPSQSFKAYLYRIAEHMAYNYFRKQALENKLEHDLIISSTEFVSSFEDNMIEKEASDRIYEAIALLPLQQRQVFTLCKIDGKSYEEVSILLGISKGTINTHITRATKSIKTHLSTGSNLTYVVLMASAISELSIGF